MEKIELTAFSDPKSPISEAYRTIRTNLQFAGVDKELKIIEVTSTVPDEGKSTVIASLAVVMAQAGKKTLLMDCDFRNPTLHKIFKVRNKGLSDCIATGGNFEDYKQSLGQENLELFPAGPVAPNPSELLTSAKMKSLLAQFREAYDYVLIDTPPILPVTDAAALASRVDGVVLVIASGQDRPEAVQLSKKRLEQADARILGCVLNKVKIGGGRYGYGRSYGYGYGYGYGYYYGGDDSKK